MSKRRGRRTKKKFPVWLIVVLVIVLVIAGGISFYIQKKNAPSTETVDLNRYFRLAEHTEALADGETKEYAAAGEDELAIVLNNEILHDRALMRDGEAYIKYSFVKREIDSRFYYDSINDLVMVTNALQKVRGAIGGSEYTIDDESVTASHPIALWNGESLYLSEEFVDTFSSMRAEVFEDPGRIVIQTKTGKVTKGEIGSDTQIREAGGNKSAIVAEVKAGDTVTVLEQLDGWTRVIDERGFPGYVKDNTVDNIHDEEVHSDYEEPEYTHIKAGDSINMLWHGVFYYGQDMEIYQLGEHVTGINVITPRWYNMNTSETYIELLSNPEYMTYAHDKGLKVWGMVTDDLVTTEDAMSILMDSYKRDVFIRTMMDDVILEGVDGLNVDFEKITDDFGDDYIQFIRELSIECRKAGVVLSVDNYTPYNFNAHFHVDQQSQCCDYVVVMAYDHYVGTDEIGPNSSVDFLEEVLDVTIPQVDPSRLIIGLPFYSRYWINRGGTDLKSETYSMYDAKQVLEDHGVEPKWDDTTGMYAAQFDYDGSQMYAWVEDASSIEAKLKFLKDYPLAGVAWWNLGQQTDDVWSVISKYY